MVVENVMDMPLVSIIMPTYNTPEEYYMSAIRSILNQSYNKFELLIIDDGSSVPIKNYVMELKDKRIKVLENKINRGLIYSLNRGLSEAKGKYIFRMDSDDISQPERIEKQVKFFESHQDVDVLSTFARTFGAADKLYSSKTEDAEIKAELLWKNPIIHPTVALRSSSIKRDGIRYSEQQVSEDFELWSRLAFEDKYKFAVIPEELLCYRLHNGQITVVREHKLQCSEREILERTFISLGIDARREELDAYCLLRHNLQLSKEEFSLTINLMKRVLTSDLEAISKTHLKKMYVKAIVKYSIKYKKVSPILCVLTL